MNNSPILTIENVPITNIVLFVFAIICCAVSFKKRRNLSRAFFVFLWGLSASVLFSFSILPIQLGNIGINDPFWSQFTTIIGSGYFFELFIQNLSSYMACFFGFLAFAFFTCLVHEKFRHLKSSIILLVILMLIHLAFNVTQNAIVGNAVKYIRGEDFIIMLLGYAAGWAMGRLLLKLQPRFASSILKNLRETD